MNEAGRSASRLDVRQGTMTIESCMTLIELPASLSDSPSCFDDNGPARVIRIVSVLGNAIAVRNSSWCFPQWFQSDPFKFILIGVFIGGLWFVVYWRMHRYAEQMKIRFDERLQERTRLARDLHDTLLQTIQASKIVADDALDLQADPIRMRTALSKLSDWLCKASEEERAALESLRIPSTESNDLAASLDRALFECRIGQRVETNLKVSGIPLVLHPVLNDEVLRIGYEAIRNACVHSKGDQLSVELEYRGNLTLMITDNGKGMDIRTLKHGKPGHFGLVGMRERADRIGAKLSIASTATGTVVSLVVPRNVVYTAAFRLGFSQ